MSERVDADLVESEAQRLSGIDDPERALFRRNLDCIVDSVNAEGRLTPLGVQITQGELTAALRNRLDTLRWIGEHPQISTERIEAPLFLTGLPRSGTTFIQNLFHQDPGLRLLRAWETAQPCPPPGFDPGSVAARVKAAQRYEEERAEIIPGFDAIHLSDADGPDECHLILTQTFGQAGFHNYLNVPGYFAHLLQDFDPLPTYAVHRRQLQLLQWCLPRRRWALKYPNHLLFMPAIVEINPDARFVVTHRDPLQTLASLCKLTQTFRASRTDAVDPLEVGRQMRGFVREHCVRLMRFVQSPQAAGRVVNVDYYRLVNAPDEQMDSLYARLGMTMPQVVRDNIQEWIRRNPKGRRGEHRYALDAFGLEVGELREEFADYQRSFDVPNEAEGAMRASA